MYVTHTTYWKVEYITCYSKQFRSLWPDWVFILCVWFYDISVHYWHYFHRGATILRRGRLIKLLKNGEQKEDCSLSCGVFVSLSLSVFVFHYSQPNSLISTHLQCFSKFAFIIIIAHNLHNYISKARVPRRPLSCLRVFTFVFWLASFKLYIQYIYNW